VANIGKARACFSVSIQGPGRGSRAASPGESASSEKGSAMPSPSASTTARAAGQGTVIA